MFMRSRVSKRAANSQMIHICECGDRGFVFRDYRFVKECRVRRLQRRSRWRYKCVGVRTTRLYGETTFFFPSRKHPFAPPPLAHKREVERMQDEHTTKVATAVKREREKWRGEIKKDASGAVSVSGTSL